MKVVVILGDKGYQGTKMLVFYSLHCFVTNLVQVKCWIENSTRLNILKFLCLIQSHLGPVFKRADEVMITGPKITSVLNMFLT